MTVTLVVVLVGLGAAAVLAGLSRVSSGAADPTDPERAEHWLVEHVARYPRLRSLIERADRRVIGSATVVVAFALTWAAALAVGWILDTVDSDRGFARWDQSVAEWGSENATDLSIDVLTVITRFGETVYLLVLMAVVGIVDFIRRRNATVFAYLAAVGLGVSALNNGLKWLILRERPVVDHLVESGGSSFPSGHSAAAAACWAALALVAGRNMGVIARPVLTGIAIGIGLAVAASRALLGVHWLTDVIAGVLVGWTWFFLVSLAFGGRFQRLGDAAERVAEADKRVSSKGVMA